MDEHTSVEEPVVPTTTPEETPVPSQKPDPIQEELDKIETKKRTPEEKLLYTYSRVKKQLADAGINPEPADEDKPLTLRDLQALRTVEAHDTALSLVDSEVTDENERKLVKHYLENTIRPSGDARTDLQNARLMANSVKNGQLAEEAGRAVRARTAPSAPSAPPRQEGAKTEFSREQTQIMKGFGLTAEEAEEALKG